MDLRQSFEETSRAAVMELSWRAFMVTVAQSCQDLQELVLVMISQDNSFYRHEWENGDEQRFRSIGEVSGLKAQIKLVNTLRPYFRT